MLAIYANKKLSSDSQGASREVRSHYEVSLELTHTTVRTRSDRKRANASSVFNLQETWMGLRLLCRRQDDEETHQEEESHPRRREP